MRSCWRDAKRIVHQACSALVLTIQRVSHGRGPCDLDPRRDALRPRTSTINIAVETGAALHVGQDRLPNRRRTMAGNRAERLFKRVDRLLSCATAQATEVHADAGRAQTRGRSLRYLFS